MPDEIRALSRLAFHELGAATAGVADVHRAIADRAFAAAPGAQPLHDAVAGLAYGAVRGGAALAGLGADAVLRRRPGGRQLSTTPRGAAALAALGGLIGDRLEREGSDLVEPMSVRSGAPGRHTVVFVHGLFETEHAWRFGGGESYGDRLESDLGCAPVLVRYNTGRHVSENGLELADLMEELVEDAGVEHIDLVGHSMGGLVARSACHVASSRGDAWVRRVGHVVSLGSPHRGAPLEEALHMASAALAAVPETRPLAALLRRRSSGIRDMRRGSLVDGDWRDRDPDALRAAACEEVPLLEGATHCFVAATVTRSATHPVGRVIGDWLVLTPSASHRAQEVLHVGGAHHLALLNHPEVYERLREWLAPRPS
jgi:pimeloyl-ACP methyl ester carboxylesterase